MIDATAGAPAEQAAVLVAAVVALPVTGWAIVEAVRARAWGWLVSMVLLWPVGVIAWFVVGRQLYHDLLVAGPPTPPWTRDASSDR